METNDKLVTLAIHSFTKAQILQNELSANGIDSFLQGMDGVIISDYVKVKIKESDLQRALPLVEELKTAETVNQELREETLADGILVPIDFSAYSWKACQFAFDFANAYHSHIVFFHSVIDDTDTHSMLESIIDFDKDKTKDELQKLLDHAHEEEGKLNAKIKAEIAAGKLPNVSYKFEVRKGVPEEEILSYAADFNPSLIIMGTRGSDQKDVELVGSVTAEIIERTKIPVFAVPEATPISTFSAIKNIAYETRFADADLMAFSKLMSMLKAFKFNIQFIHYDKNDSGENDGIWSEIKLSGIRDYFEKNYPNLHFEYNLLTGDDELSALDKFVKEKQIDVVSLTTHRRSLFFRLFNPSIAKRMVIHSDTPMLVFHV